jgi:uncharacterized membrane protein
VLGASSVPAAAVALGACAGASLMLAALAPRTARAPFAAGAAIGLLYLASVAIVSAFQPGFGEVGDTLLDLSVRQQGQVLLSAMWSMVGIVGLTIGLRRDWRLLRLGALGLLLATVAKVFLYDLATLNSVYRVASFVALGVVLLAGAYAYQRRQPRNGSIA